MRIIKTFTALILLSAVTCTHAATFSYGYYNEKAKTCAITAYNGGDTETLTIPDNHKYNGITYKVKGVRDNVFNGLKSLTTVNIGPNLEYIGSDASKGYTPTNFMDCPNLKRFSVDAANPEFASSPGGILTCEYQMSIYRVPPKISTSNGTLTLSKKTSHIGESAFSGVTTVSTLNLGPVTSVSNNGGLSEMPNLKKIGIVTEAGDRPSIAVTPSGLLVDTHYEPSGEEVAEIVSLPPKSDISTLSLPASVTVNGRKLAVYQIEYRAFANCANLKSISLPEGIKEIHYQSFAGAGITALSIPASATLIGEGILAGCPNLTKVTFHANKPCISKNFARESRKLSSLVFKDGAPECLEQSAFKNCTSLASFPFTSIRLVEDSVFANTGFTKVTFDKEATNGGWWSTKGTFTGCRQLTTIDLSAEKGEMFRKGYATNCPNLKTILFPQTATIEGQSFGINNALSKIVLGNFELPDGPVFGYSEDASPRVYIVTRKTWPDLSVPMGKLFKPSSGAKVTPRVYTDAWTLTDTGGRPDYYGDNSSPIKDATIYIPALASHNYRRYTKSSKVTEMFTLSITRSGSKTRIEYRPVISGIKFSSINLGDGNSIALNPDGAVKTADLAFSKIKSVTLAYSVNGVEMLTRYPKDAFNDGQTSIDDVTGDMPSLRLEGRVARFDTEVSYTVSDMHGRVAVSGHGSEADLSTLPAGVYIVHLPLTTHKILLR